MRKALLQQSKAGFTYKSVSATINICGIWGFGIAIELSNQEHNHLYPRIRADSGTSYYYIATSGSPLPLPTMDFIKCGTRIICKATISINDCTHFSIKGGRWQRRMGKHSLFLQKNNDLKNQGLSFSSTNQWLQANSITSIWVTEKKRKSWNNLSKIKEAPISNYMQDYKALINGSYLPRYVDIKILRK